MVMREDQPADARPPAVQRLLAEHSGARERIVDDHMFVFQRHGYPPSTFRLQLFTQLGLRPVAVVTQTAGEGASLINRAERYVEAVWQRHCTDDPTPPIWIQHQLLREDAADDLRHAAFDVTGPHQVGSPPRWGARLAPGDLAELVSAPVDLGRGSGFLPRPPEPEPQLRYTTALVALLPRPDLETDQRPCMRVGLGWWHRVGRQLRPTHTGRSCCWYHRGDWHEVSRMAIATATAALRHGVEVEDVAAYVLSHATADHRLEGWSLEALESLFVEPIETHRPIGYVGGRHRAKAMMDAGVRRTLVVLYTSSHGD
ncbi:hypothetical protein [Asanoa hainanensis]|nr:hypothetical protein [Asanoa hainanensis]